MPANLERRFRPRMTLRQIGVLVVFAAVGSAVVMPELRQFRGNARLVLVWTLELPLALIVASILLIRRGPLKLWIVSFLCFVPYVSLIVFLNLFIVWIGVWNSGSPSVVQSYRIVIVACEVVLLGGLIYLIRKLVPGFCPLCGRPAMLRDVSVPRSSAFSTHTEPRSCLACGARFRRIAGGPWVDVDDLPDPGPNSRKKDAPR